MPFAIHGCVTTMCLIVCCFLDFVKKAFKSLNSILRIESFNVLSKVTSNAWVFSN